jgi:hypothetical protein
VHGYKRHVTARERRLSVYQVRSWKSFKHSLRVPSLHCSSDEPVEGGHKERNVWRPKSKLSKDTPLRLSDFHLREITRDDPSASWHRWQRVTYLVLESPYWRKIVAPINTVDTTTVVSPPYYPPPESLAKSSKLVMRKHNGSKKKDIPYPGHR